MLLKDLWKRYGEPVIKKNIQNYQKVGRYLSSEPTLAQRFIPVVGPIRSLMNIKRDIQNPQSYQRQMITGVGRTTADIANLAQKINIPSQIANRVLPEKLTPQYNVNRFRNFVYSQPRATTLEGKIGSFIGENAPYFAIPTGGSANYGSKTFSSLARSTPKVMQKIPLMQAAKIAGRKELLSNIGREAVQGAGFMGGLAIGQNKSPKEVARDILIGAGFGAGARAGIAGVEAGIGRVANKIKVQDAINSIKNPTLREKVSREIGLLQSKPGFAKLPKKPESKPIISKELEALAEEARKYKSAEEFIKAQGTPVYRTEKADIAYKGKSVWGDGKYFGIDKNQVKEMTISPHSGKSTGGKVDEYVIPSNLKIKEIDISWEAMKPEDFNKFARGNDLKKQILNEGYDGVILKTDGDLNLGGDQLIMYKNADQIKTKSQLTEIWNKANKNKATTPLKVNKTAKGIRLPLKDKKATEGLTTSVPPVKKGISKGLSITETELATTKQYLENLIKQEAKLRQSTEEAAGVGMIRHELTGKGSDEFTRFSEHSPEYRAYFRRTGHKPSLSWWKDQVKKELESGKGALAEEYNSIKNYLSQVERQVAREGGRIPIENLTPRSQKVKIKLYPQQIKITGQKDAGKIKDIPVKLKTKEGVIRPKGRGELVPPDFEFGKWRDKRTFQYYRETLERNIEDIAGADAPLVKNFTTDQIKANETQRANFITNLRNEIESKVKGWGIVKGSEDDALIQRFGEGRITEDKLPPNKAKQIKEAAGYFRNKYDELLDLINQKRAEYGYEPIPKRKDYFRHFQEIGNAIDNVGLIFKQEELPVEIAGLTDIFKPGKPFSSTELPRKGGKFTESAIKGMDNYIDSISKQIFHLDSVQRVRTLENYIRGTGDVANLPRFAANLHEYGNLLAGKKARFDRAFEDALGREAYGVINLIKRQTSANMIGANISSALTNFIPFTQSLASTSKGSAIKGIFEGLLTPLKRSVYDIDGITSGLLIRRYPKETLLPRGLETAKEFANTLFRGVDLFSARSIIAGKYYEGIKKGLPKNIAMRQADDYASKLLADRSWGQLPNLMGTKTLGAVTQFQTEINNMFSNITKDIPRMAQNKAHLASMLGQFVIYSYLFNDLFEKVVGRRPTIDPINATMTLFGQNEQGKDKPLGKRIYLAGKDIGENLPFIGGITGGRLPISSGFPDIAGMLQGKANVTQELAKPVAFLAPPFGGLQTKKTIEGLTSYKKGAVETKGKVKFPIEKNLSNLVRSGLFGQYSTPEAREYFSKERRPLSERQSSLFRAGAKTYESIMAEREQEKKLKELKEGKKPVEALDLGNELYQVGDRIYSRVLDREFDTPEEAQLAIEKDKLPKKKGSYKVVGDKIIYYDSKTGKIKDENYADFEDKVYQENYKLQKQTFKDTRDYNSYRELQKLRFQYLDEKIKNADPIIEQADILKWRNEQADIIREIEKYDSYGGFTKRTAKKSSKAKYSFVSPKLQGVKGISAPTRRARRQILLPQFKKPNITFNAFK